jgi:hypothetical protein
LQQIGPSSASAFSEPFQIEFRSGSPDWEHARLHLKLTADGANEAIHDIDLLVAPEDLPRAPEVMILDGRTKTFAVFRQKGNQGGGSSVERTVTEGKGNGDGTLQPGEQATFWLKLPAGLDAFDRGNWCRTKVYTDSPFLTEIADIQEDKQREWTGARNRTSLVELGLNVPPETSIPLVLDCESWSFHFTPDARYGKELLYQAFQLHKHHLFRYTWGGQAAPKRFTPKQLVPKQGGQ